jgi:phosphate/sulfate permease
MLLLLVIAVLVVAYANGANANFKGVASLFGSGTTSYCTAVNWAAVTTAAGCVTAMFLASSMLKAFSGKGLVPDALIAQPGFLLAVAASAAVTGVLATRFGFPVSTTHMLTGALLGAGWIAGDVNVAKLWESFMKPLLLSPVLAVMAGGVMYLVLKTLRLAPDHRTRTLDALHFLSAGAVCFARGLNDTPKMAALLLGIGWLQGSAGMILDRGGDGAGRFDQRETGGGDAGAQDHWHESRPGLRGESRHGDARDDGEPAWPAGFHHACLRRCAARHRHHHAAGEVAHGHSGARGLDHHTAVLGTRRCAAFQNPLPMRTKTRALTVAAFAAVSSAFGTPTGLNNIPTADTVPHRTVAVQYFSSFGGANQFARPSRAKRRSGWASRRAGTSSPCIWNGAWTAPWAPA